MARTQRPELTTKSRLGVVAAMVKVIAALMIAISITGCVSIDRRPHKACNESQTTHQPQEANTDLAAVIAKAWIDRNGDGTFETMEWQGAIAENSREVSLREIIWRSAGDTSCSTVVSYRFERMIVLRPGDLDVVITPFWIDHSPYCCFRGRFDRVASFPVIDGNSVIARVEVPDEVQLVWRSALARIAIGRNTDRSPVTVTALKNTVSCHYLLVKCIAYMATKTAHVPLADGRVFKATDTVVLLEVPLGDEYRTVFRKVDESVPNPGDIPDFLNSSLDYLSTVPPGLRR